MKRGRKRRQAPKINAIQNPTLSEFKKSSNVSNDKSSKLNASKLKKLRKGVQKYSQIDIDKISPSTASTIVEAPIFMPVAS